MGVMLVRLSSAQGLPWQLLAKLASHARLCLAQNAMNVTCCDDSTQAWAHLDVQQRDVPLFNGQHTDALQLSHHDFHLLEKVRLPGLYALCQCQQG